MEEDIAENIATLIGYLQQDAENFTKLVEENKTHPKGIVDGLKDVFDSRLNLWRERDPRVEENMVRQRWILKLQSQAYLAIKAHLLPSDAAGKGVEVRKCKLALAKLIRFSTDHYTSVLRTIFRSYTIEDFIGGLFGRNPILDQLLLKTKDADVKNRLKLGRARNSKLIEFAAALLLRLGDIDRYHQRLQEEHKNCEKFYAASLILDPRHGVAWNGLAASISHCAVSEAPKFELIYTFYRASTAVIPFKPAIENCKQWIASVAKRSARDDLDVFYVLHGRIWKRVPLPDDWRVQYKEMLSANLGREDDALQRMCLANIAAYAISRAGRDDSDPVNAARNDMIANGFLCLCIQTLADIMLILFLLTAKEHKKNYRLSSSVRLSLSWFVLNVDAIIADVEHYRDERLTFQLTKFFKQLCLFGSFVLDSFGLRNLKMPEYLLDCDLDVLGFAPLDRPDNEHLYIEGKLRPYQYVDYDIADWFELPYQALKYEQHDFHFHGYARDVLALVRSDTAPVEMREVRGRLDFVSTMGEPAGSSRPAYKVTQTTTLQDLRSDQVVVAAPPVSNPNQQWVPPSSPPQAQEALPSFEIPSSQPEPNERPQEAPKPTQQETTTFGGMGSSTVAMLEGQIGDARQGEQKPKESQRAGTQNTEQRFFSTGVSQDVPASDSLLAGVDQEMN